MSSGDEQHFRGDEDANRKFKKNMGPGKKIYSSQMDEKRRKGLR